MGRKYRRPRLYTPLAHQHKADAFVHALKNAGWLTARSPKIAEFILADFCRAGLFSGYNPTPRRQIERAMLYKKPIILYPHSYSPALPYDLGEPLDCLTAFMAPSPGFAEVLRRIGYTCPIDVVGWSLSEVRPFAPVKTKKPRVLFAPTHPVRSMPICEKEANARTYALLLENLEKGKIQSLSMRAVGRLEPAGLWKDDRVNYIRGSLNGSTADMDAADVVVSFGTYAYMSIALGKPTVIFGQNVHPHNSPAYKGELLFANNWHAYREYMRYPHAIECDMTAADALKSIKAACTKEPKQWRERFIGQPFDGDYFLERLDYHLCQPLT